MLSPQEVYWRCRRGMLEVDLFLIPFFEAHFDKLSPSEQTVFVELLEMPDPELFNLLMDYAVPEEKYRDIILKIRDFKLKRD